jgi:hypothetical protein
MGTWIIRSNGAADLSISGPDLVSAIEASLDHIARHYEVGGPSGYELRSVTAHPSPRGERIGGRPFVALHIVARPSLTALPEGRRAAADRWTQTVVVIETVGDELTGPVTIVDYAG